MRYDPELKDFYFNTEMILSAEGRQELYDTHDDWISNMMANPGQTFRSLATGVRPSTGDSGSGITPLKLFMSIGIIVAFLGFIVCCITNHFDIGAWIGAGILGLIGILMIFATGSDSSDNIYNRTESMHELPIFSRLQGLVFLIAAAAVIYARLNQKYYTMSEIFVWCFVWAFGIIGVIMLLKGISQLVAIKRLYTEEINATCIGYLRTLESTDHGNHIIKTSPVFEYYYQGEQFKSVYDIFLSKPNGTIPVGSSTIIKIDPNSPEHIMGDSKRSGTGFVTVGIILLLVMIIPLMIIKTGLVNEGELRMSGIGAPKYERMISDDLITKEYGSDWYIEKLKISSVTEEQEGDLKYLHVIVDDSFKEINTSTDFGYSEGEEVYVIYHMITVDGELKKEALNFVAAEGTGYTGAHKAYR